MDKKLVIGILAHVDAGKTTLSESMLYLSGKIRKPGRVDNGSAYLDTYDIEKARGITIFSKQALFQMNDLKVTLLDTPGHIDFSAEMERTLQVLDYAVLLINGADGIQGHTKTLWHLLKRYQIPIFLFVNKMDREGIDKEELIEEIRKQLDERCLEFGIPSSNHFYEELALCEEGLMESYLRFGTIEMMQIRQAVKNRKVFPCYFGSALKLKGVETFMKGISDYAIAPKYSNEFGAKVFKISRDEQGVRLTHMKITGGNLQVKDRLVNPMWEEKVNQIRIYSGERFETVSEIEAGSICAVAGLNQAQAGDGLGFEAAANAPLLEAVLSYQMILPKECNPQVILPKLRQLEEEEPTLHIAWNEALQEIQVQIMGEVQIEILRNIIQDRFDVKVDFGEGKIVYKETIADVIEGVGHFEPLRHYAEVHLLLEPAARGSGLQFFTKCSEEILAGNWQRLILTHLKEKVHKGVLTGSPITDMKITLVSGKAHSKHTEGGDFREATYRAVRQGLKEAKSLLLEPFYSFQLELPERMIGRAMSDIEKMKGTSEILRTENGVTVLTGSAPVSLMQNYQKEVTAYTKGLGRLFCSLKSYDLCQNEAEVKERMDYDSERDLENPTGSVFCANGTGFLVQWDEVKKYMHVERFLSEKADVLKQERSQMQFEQKKGISLEEIKHIMQKTFYANQGKKSAWKREREKITRAEFEETIGLIGRKETDEEYLLVDGYNIIYAWPELKEIAEKNMDGARIQLLDVLSNYQAMQQCKIIVVFDAYRVQGHREEMIDYHNIRMVYTREAQPADQYIEKFAYDNKGKYKITVATSDGLQQMIVRGAGSLLLSARELKLEIEAVNERMRQEYKKLNETSGNRLLDSLSSEMKEQIKGVLDEE